jgi:hypothetical protein
VKDKSGIARIKDVDFPESMELVGNDPSDERLE